jgi:flagellar hook-associated protein 1 FlgK
LAELSALINNASEASGVESFLKADGSLLVRNIGADNQGNPITFGAVGAILDLTGEINPSVVVEFQRTDEGVTEQEVSLTLGSSGSFEDLSKLGFRGAVELTGKMEEELIVFASGADGTKAKISADYVEGEVDDLPLFDRELELEFTSPEAFEIRDRATNTVLAERSYDFSGQVSYQGIALSISGSPVSGDVFSISANKGGIGGTGNLARMSQLEEADIFDGDQTLQQGYLSLLNKAGTISKQADVARQALEVLKDQAVESRASLAGVNLDEEAASLIRFQQSYQASARLVQTANELFETIVRL